MPCDKNGIIVKEGDIVWVEKWGGVIGEVASYNGYKLVLIFPRKIYWKYTSNNLFNPREFTPSSAEEITVLSAKEVLEKMVDIFSRRLKDIRDSIVSKTTLEFNAFEM